MWHLRWIVILSLLVVPSLLADRWMTQWIQASTPLSLPGDLHRVLRLSEAFAHGLTVTFIVCLVCRLKQQSALFWYLAASSLGAGLTADVIKLIVHRSRPHALLASDVCPSEVSCGLFHLNIVCASMGSFPSAHTATAVGLAAALSRIAPRGSAFFWLAACTAGLQRIDAMAHYPTDVLAGFAVGLFVHRCCLRWLRPSHGS